MSIPFLTGGCYRGYKSSEDLETEQRGPAACAKSCSDLGMRMTAFVLVEHTTSGCVCAPVAVWVPGPPPGAPAPGPGSAAPRPTTAPPTPPTAAPAPPPPPPESMLEGGSAGVAAAYVVIEAEREAERQAAQQRAVQQNNRH